jgi:type IV pilus assembly protein PilY1
MLKDVFIAVFICLILVPGAAMAEDTEIFGGGTINVPPNILIIFDNSGSMDDDPVQTCQASAPYNPNGNYPVKKTVDWIYYKSGGSWYQLGSSGPGHVSVSDLPNDTCANIKGALNTDGYVWASITITRKGTKYSYSCSGTSSTKYATGRYLNYLDTRECTSTREKCDIARETIFNLIKANPSVRWGVMSFNRSGSSPDHGGRLVIPCKDWSNDMNTILGYFYSGYPNGKHPGNSSYTEYDKTGYSIYLQPYTWTPLAETLAEAGLYFARKQSWSNSDNYATMDPAILWRCQKNYVIIMTDGDSTYDQGDILTKTYINNKIIGDYDSSGQNELTSYYDEDNVLRGIPNGDGQIAARGSDYLNDVSKFLYDNDLLLGNVTDESGASFGNDYTNPGDFTKQNIITYTICVDPDNVSDFGKSLLKSAAANGHGKYFGVSDNIQLQDAFDSILTEIFTDNSQFVSPVVPVNRVNRTYADNAIYLGIFAPNNTNPGVWLGNLKKFGFSRDGTIMQVNDGIDPDPAVDENGTIDGNALSAWNAGITAPEGMQVNKGGAGASMMSDVQTSRTFITHRYAAEGVPAETITFTLADMAPNELGDTFKITAADLDLDTNAKRDDLLKFVTAGGKYAWNSTDAKHRTWVLGDIVHSQPAVYYDRNSNGGSNVIFVGANDGFLHCFEDSSEGYPDNLTKHRVRERWAFMPWDILPNLKYLPSSGNMTDASTKSTDLIDGDANHDYFVDGSPTVYKSNGTNYIAFGLRRGGTDITTNTEFENQYFILSFSGTSTYTPTFVNAIPKDILGIEKLGQSWCTPRFCKLRTGTTTDSNGKPIPVSKDVLLLTGGYDTNQDENNGTTDTKGRAVFAVNAQTGAIDGVFNYNYGNGYTNMRYCMVDLRSYDDDDDGCDDVVYAPSVGGDLFVYDGRHTGGDGDPYDGSWKTPKLLFQAAPQSSTKLRKFLYAPGIAQEMMDGQLGDYVFIGSGDRENPSDSAIINRFYAIKNKWSANQNNGAPLTDDNLANVTNGLPDNFAVAGKDGWYFNLSAGEKMVSTPIVYNKVVYFTTYSPTAAAQIDKCGVGSQGSGVGRLYAVDYKTGNAVFKEFDSDKDNLNVTSDRSYVLGSSIPSPPTLVVCETGTYVLVGTQEGVRKQLTNDNNTLKRYYWYKQLDD